MTVVNTAGAVVERPGLAHPSAPTTVQYPALERVPLGETGFSVTPLILGGAEFGWNVDAETSHAIIDAFVERGGNALHTADTFSAGRSEHIIGQWLRSRSQRDEIVLAIRVGGHPDTPGLGSVDLVRAVEASLTRLQTEYLDVLYVDTAADPGCSIEDILATADWLVDSGKVRALGMVSVTAAHLVEARILSAAGYPLVSVLDVPFNVLRQNEFDADLQLVAQAQRIAVTPSRALEHGFLAGHQRTRIRIGNLDARAAQMAEHVNKRGHRVLKALDAVGADLGAPNASVAVAWLLAQSAVTAPIVNAYAVLHIDELMRGAGLSLGRTHLTDIARAAS